MYIYKYTLKCNFQDYLCEIIELVTYYTVTSDECLLQSEKAVVRCKYMKT